MGSPTWQGAPDPARRLLAPTAASAALADSVRTNLDAMDAATRRALVLALVALWFGLDDGRAPHLVVLDVRVPLERSVWVLAAVLTATTAECAARMARVASAIASLDVAQARAAVGGLWAHAWLFNPLAWHGAEAAGRRSATIAAASLLGLFALMMAAVFSLGTVAERAVAAEAASVTALGCGLFAAASREVARRAREAFATADEDDGAAARAACDEVWTRARHIAVVTGAGVVAALALSAWWATG